MKRFPLFAMILACTMSGTLSSAEKLPSETYVVHDEWLTQFYADQTWDWGNGHAYFGPDGTFQAALSPGQSGEGKWYAKEDGKLCFKGSWSSPLGSGPAKKCWRHVKDKQGRLWQAPLSGWIRLKWSVFDPDTQLTPGNINKSKFEYASGKAPTADIRRLTDQELIDLYYTYTWKWDDGHGHFANRGVFTAVSGANSFGEGMWYPDGDGELCIKARWSGPDFSRVKRKTCWIHVEDADGNILQTPSDDLTAWSIFVPKDSMVKGDLYQEQFIETKAALTQ